MESHADICESSSASSVKHACTDDAFAGTLVKPSSDSTTTFYHHFMTEHWFHPRNPCYLRFRLTTLLIDKMIHAAMESNIARASDDELADTLQACEELRNGCKAKLAEQECAMNFNVLDAWVANATQTCSHAAQCTLHHSLLQPFALSSTLSGQSDARYAFAIEGSPTCTVLFDYVVPLEQGLCTAVWH